MITTRLFGRTGNQMFQCAQAIAYAKAMGCEYHIPAHTMNDEAWPPTFSILENRNFNPSLQEYVVKELAHSFNDIPKYECKKINVVFNGYWQSYKYFDHIRQDILSTFNIPWYLHEGTCSVHIRRGDYLHFPDKHPTVTEKYLDRAISQMIDEGINDFVFFSDDLDWTKSYARRMKYKIRYSVSENANPMADMRVMSSCNHQIIANSTFSWWAAYLNQAENKIVITPHENNWFGSGNEHLDVSDLLPKSWHRIKY